MHEIPREGKRRGEGERCEIVRVDEMETHTRSQIDREEG